MKEISEEFFGWTSSRLSLLFSFSEVSKVNKTPSVMRLSQSVLVNRLKVKERRAKESEKSYKLKKKETVLHPQRHWKFANPEIVRNQEEKEVNPHSGPSYPLSTFYRQLFIV